MTWIEPWLEVTGSRRIPLEDEERPLYATDAEAGSPRLTPSLSRQRRETNIVVRAAAQSEIRCRTSVPP